MGKIVELVRRQLWIGPLVGLVIGLLIGLGIGWMTVEFRPGADDVSAVADSYSLNSDAALARARLKNLPEADLKRMIGELIRDRTAKGLSREVDRLTALQQVLVGGQPLPNPTPGGARPPGSTPAPSAPPASSGGLDPLVSIGLIAFVVILIVAAGAIFYFRVLPTMKARPPRPARATTGQAAATAPTAPAAPSARETPGAPAATTAPGGLGRFVPQYNLGNDNYDTSYSLETARGEFLGECGMGISETIGEGKPDKVTAFDLWLFDKADVRTVTKILMTDYAYKDQTLRTKLATKGETVLAERGKILQLETASLRIEAQIVELVYANNPNYPPNSHFQKLIVEIVPVHKAEMAAAR